MGALASMADALLVLFVSVFSAAVLSPAGLPRA
jgi:hypothetical protein